MKKPKARYFSEMKKTVLDKKWAKNISDFPVYYMYRGIKEKNGLRYDITLIPPKMLGKEFTKTKGHEHLGKYKEIYLVLKGEAIYLLQKRKKNGSVKDVYALRAKKGEAAIIPSFYGHVTINPSPEKELKMANWISKNCQSDYGFFEKMEGACYFYTKNGWLKNKKYKKVPKLKFKKPLKKVPKDLTFLKE